jgi:hypothetical protein
MSDDFEKAVLINFNYGGNIDPQLKVMPLAEELQQHQQQKQCWQQQALTLSAADMSAGKSSSIHCQHQAVFRLLEAVL